MRILFSTGSPADYMAPPRLGAGQVNCGPDFADQIVDGRIASLKSPVGAYDIATLAARLPASQAPDAVVCLVDASLRNLPTNLGQFKCPKVLLVADTHHLRSPLRNLLRYATTETFDRIILLYDRHQWKFFRAAGLKNLFWFPGLTFPHTDEEVARSRTNRNVRSKQIAFVGQTGRFHPRRARLVEALVQAGLPVCAKQIPQQEGLKLYGASVIGLNVSLNGDLNLRVFEILASGATLLTDQLGPDSGMDQLWSEDQLLTYRNEHELLERAAHYLKQPAEAAAIAKRGMTWFDSLFSEKKRHLDFERIVFDGVPVPEFALPTTGAKAWFADAPQQRDNAIRVYERVQELHRQQEAVTVAIDAAASKDVVEMFTTLPRVSTRRSFAGQSDLAVVSAFNLDRVSISQAARVWVFDAAQSSVATALSTSRLQRIDRELALFGREPQEIEEAKPRWPACWTCLNAGDYTRAMELARAMLAKNPKDVDGLVTMADLALEARNLSLATRLVQTAEQVAPADERVIELKQQLAKFPRAPQLPQRLLDTARRLVGQGELKAARTFVEKALQADPTLAGAQALLVEIESKLGAASQPGNTAMLQPAARPARHQNLLMAAARAQQPADLIPVFRDVVADRSLDNGAATQLLVQLSATPAIAHAKATASTAPAATPVAVVAYQPWFGFDYVRLTQLGLAENLVLPLFTGLTLERTATLAGLTEDNFREYRHRSVLLWPVCHYRVCYRLGVMPEEVTTVPHWNAVRDAFVEAAGYVDAAFAMCAFYRPQSVVIAQGYDLLGAAMRHVAVERGLRVVALENIFRKDRLLWDDTSGITVNRNLARNYYWRHAETLSPDTAAQTVRKYFDGIGSLKSLEHASPVTADAPRLPAGDGSLLVYLAQVGIDSSVLYGRLGFRSQVEIIHALASYALHHGCRVFIKLHPKESAGYKYSEAAFRRHTAGALEQDQGFSEVRRQLGERLIIDEDNRYNTYDLIQAATLCVTLNSQAGLEALALGKEVIVCGQVFYGGLGFSHEAPDAPALEFILGRILRHGLRRNDAVAVNRFFHSFVELYCVPKTEEGLLALARGRPVFRRPSGHSHLAPSAAEQTAA